MTNTFYREIPFTFMGDEIQIEAMFEAFDGVVYFDHCMIGKFKADEYAVKAMMGADEFKACVEAVQTWWNVKGKAMNAAGDARYARMTGRG